MKIRDDHYKAIADACNVTLAANPGVTLATYESQGLSPMRFNFDVLYASRIEGMSASAWVSANLYSYMNDEHIGTALKRIMDNSGKSGKQLKAAA